MVELYGWATVRNFNPNGENENLENIENILREKINQYIWNNNSGLAMVNFESLNGELTLMLSIKGNRKRQETIDVFDLYEFIAKTAKDSYGVLYFHDDEDLEGKENIFQIYSLSRGKLVEHKDELLSPLIPKIDDEY